MNKINIPFRGMTNVPDDSFSQDGSMSVLLNMRHKGGELVPVEKPTSTDAANVRQALFHAQTGFWVYLKSGGLLEVEGVDEQGGFRGQTIKESGVNSFAILGNVVIMYLENSVEYAIWRGGYYELLGELPRIYNRLSFILKGDGNKELVKTSYGEEDQVKTDKVGKINELLDLIYKEGGFIDRVWFRVAYRLFDGSYLSISEIKQVSWYGEGERDYFIGMFNTSKHLYVHEDTTSQLQYKYSVRYFNVDMSLNLAFPEKWRDIIAGVDVFTTGSIPSFVLKKDGDSEYYDGRTIDEFRDGILNAEFYKMAEYDIKGKLLWKIDNTSPSNLAVQKTLTEANNDIYTANDSYINNNLLHIYNYKKLLFPGYGIGEVVSKVHGSHPGGNYIIYVVINTNDGDVIVKNKVVLRGVTPLRYYSYPDYRAYKMYVYDEDEDTWRMYSLNPHPYRNESYIFEAVYMSVEVFIDELDSYIVSGYVLGAVEGVSVGNPGLKVDSYELVRNTLRVSAVDNPFYFPTSQTYKFDSDIMGVMTNAEAISTGQFGQYPLYVFTKNGIWAMQVDASGKGAYVSQSPFSKEVCSGAICAVSGGIVFTTERGVMAISGGQVTELSAPLDGLNNEILEESWGLCAEIYKVLIGGDIGESMRPMPIRDYIKGVATRIAYNYLHNEVIVSNIAHDYSYVYNLTNNEWSVIDKTFDVPTNKYPELIVFNSKDAERLDFSVPESGTQDVFLVTRPIKVDTLDFKRLRQAALRCTFDGVLGFYILGSNDGASFVCIAGKEYGLRENPGMHRDLITSMSRSKQYKYIAIAVAGKMKGRISLAEMLVEGGFASNQLR